MKKDTSDFGFVNKFDDETHRSLLHTFQVKDIDPSERDQANLDSISEEPTIEQSCEKLNQNE